MKTYVVGGAVRDRLLGLPVSDRDHVVVGATVDEMIAAGFKPVGKDFPVFLHPTTHEEYALARTERKVAPGYAGFVFHADPSVTLEADLARRDLTINAMAEDETGRLVDPFGGESDLNARRFRHVGPAFGEDPVRILRVARFAARFTDFTVVDDTMTLMREMVASGEVDALVPERVWQELSRGLMESRPSRMVDLLSTCGALARLLPEVDLLDRVEPARGVVMRRAIDVAAQQAASLPVLFATFVAAFVATVDGVEAVCTRLHVASAVRDVAVLLATHRETLERIDGEHPSADAIVSLMERGDAFRRPARFEQVLEAHTIARDVRHLPSRAKTWRTALAAARAIDAGAIARAAAYEPGAVARGLHTARVEAVARML